MALETPNAIVAAAVVLFDAGGLQKFLTMSSNGIQNKAEGAGYSGLPAASYELETPVTPDEGCLICNANAEDASFQSFITPTINPSPAFFGTVNQVAIQALGSSAYGRLCFQVLRLIRP